MTTNREWLYSLDVAELADWFDAQHVDANDALSAENDVSAADADANDANAAHDSREKLEADMRSFASQMITVGANQNDYVLEVITNHVPKRVVELLDRQATITERELCKQCDWPSLAAQPDLESQERIAELTAQVDELAQQLANARADCEQYRELLSQAITHAHEIVNLQP